MTFKMGDICYCKASKDIVKICNGINVAGIANASDTFTPTEALALRVVSFGQTKDGLYPQIGFTYRAVNVADLERCNSDLFAIYFDSMTVKVQPKFRIGRV